MRTTLDIDDNLLAIARVRAREKGISIGAAVSEIMRKGLEVPMRRSKRGFPIFELPPEGPVITSEMVARYRDDDPTEE
jgi:plasmid stability protein